MMPSRRVDVFFYGVFMDQELLRAKGVRPEGTELASVPGFKLRIGQRAALVPDPSERVYGVVMSLSLAELDQLYSEPGLQTYTPQAVLAQLASGGTIPALCYNVPGPPSLADRNSEYATKLRAIGQKIGLPADYLALLQ